MEAGKSLKIGRMVAMISAILVIIGAFLPWASIIGISITGVGEGFDKDGVITLSLAVIAVILLLIKKVPLWITMILSVLILATLVYDYHDIFLSNSELDDHMNPFAELAKIKMRSGFYLSVLGGIGLLVGPIIDYCKGCKKK